MSQSAPGEGKACIKVVVTASDELRFRQLAALLGTRVSVFFREAALERLAREEQAARMGGADA